MKTTHEVEIPAHKETRRLLMICDICNTQTKQMDWRDGLYDVAETEVVFREGTRYPEGGSGIETTIDICPKCFVERLIPWVESFGNKVQKKEWDC